MRILYSSNSWLRFFRGVALVTTLLMTWSVIAPAAHYFTSGIEVETGYALPVVPGAEEEQSEQFHEYEKDKRIRKIAPAHLADTFYDTVFRSHCFSIRPVLPAEILTPPPQRLS